MTTKKTLEERLAERTDHCADCIEVNEKYRAEIAAVVEASEHFKHVDYRVASDGTFMYSLGDGLDLSDDNKLILTV